MDNCGAGAGANANANAHDDIDSSAVDMKIVVKILLVRRGWLPILIPCLKKTSIDISYKHAVLMP